MKNPFKKLFDEQRTPQVANQTSIEKDLDQGLHLISNSEDPIVECAYTHQHVLKSEMLILDDSIIAIHGDPGHWKDSWTDRDSGTFWLENILPLEIPGCRVFSYGYKTGVENSVEEIAETLLRQMSAIRESQSSHPVVFLAHSFGALLLKAVIIAPYSQLQSSKADDW